MSIQTKGDVAICSSVGDVEKLESFKKLTKPERIAKLQEVYDTYGVKSNQFFKQVKPFIMWTVYKHLRGMNPATYLEDLINNAYEELVVAFNGGYLRYYHRTVYMEPTYQNQDYFDKGYNIGTFVMKVVTSSVSKYRSRNFKIPLGHMDFSMDIYDKCKYTNFEELNSNLSYDKDDFEYVKYFKYFKFNKAFRQHLKFIRTFKPKNNVLYHFMIWKETCFE